MAVNGPPFSIKLWIYPDANPAALPHLWGESIDISNKIRHPGNDGGQPITYTYGRSDEGKEVDAATMSLTLDNRTGDFSTKNVLGQYYGRLKKNNPIVMGVVSAYDSFNRTTVGSLGTADSGHGYGIGLYLTTNGSQAVASFTAANQSTVAILPDSGGADFDVTMTASVQAVTTGAAVLVGGLQYNIADTSYIIFGIEFQPGGVVATRLQRVGTSGGTALLAPTTATAYTYTANQLYRIRFARTGADVRLKVWPAASAEPTTWQASGKDPYMEPCDIGFIAWRFAGNTNAGTYAAYVDDITVVPIEFTGTVTQYPVRWNKAATNCWAPIQASGVLRRLQQGNQPIESPLTRQLPYYNPTGYWPCEDGSDAATFANKVNKGTPAIFTNVSPASDTSLAGATGLPVFSAANGAIRASTRIKHIQPGFSAMYFTKFASLPASKTTVAIVTSTGRAVQWVLSISSTLSYVEAFDSSGTLLSSASNLFAPLVPTEWVAWQLETDVVAGNTEWAFIFHQVGLSTYAAQSGSHSSSAFSRATAITIGNSDLNGLAVGQIWLGPNTLPFVAASFSLVSDGYRGELASDRILRLCTEQNIPVAIEPGVSEPLGPQSQNNILDAIRSASSSDYGILYERGAGLGFRPHASRYAQPALLNLAVSAGEIDEPPEPTDDDQAIRNYWRVDREGGSYAIAYDQEHIDSEGYYPDQATINVQSDDLLINHAGWRVYMGTRPELRWPGISLNFLRNPQLLGQWRKRKFGPRIVITTGRPQVTGADPDVIAEGFTATLAPREWNATLNCSSAKPFDIAALDNGVRCDAESSTLDTAVATVGAITIQVTNNGDVRSTWVPTSTYPTEVPFNIVINGEVMTVTDVGNIFSTTKQTLTVTRGVNGGAKVHAAGSAVRLEKPTYIAL